MHPEEMGRILQLTTAVLGSDPSLTADYSPDYQPGTGHGLWAGKAGSPLALSSLISRSRERYWMKTQARPHLTRL